MNGKIKYVSDDEDAPLPSPTPQHLDKINDLINPKKIKNKMAIIQYLREVDWAYLHMLGEEFSKVEEAGGPLKALEGYYHVY